MIEHLETVTGIRNTEVIWMQNIVWVGWRYNAYKTESIRRDSIATSLIKSQKDTFITPSVFRRNTTLNMVLLPLSLLLTSALALPQSPDPGPVTTDKGTNQLIADLENNFSIDSNSRPVNRVVLGVESTCLPWFFTCTSVSLRLDQILQKGTAKVSHTPIEEASLFNDTEDPATLAVEKSRAVTKSTTKGWTVGGQISGGGGFGGGVPGAPTGNVGLQLSGSYSSAYTEGTTVTSTVRTIATCRPQHECKIETWTFHVTVTGECLSRPVFDCGGDNLACGKDEHFCDQFKAFAKKQCKPEITDKPRSCTVETPINKQSGEPLSRLVLISRALGSAADSGVQALSADEPIIEFID